MMTKSDFASWAMYLLHFHFQIVAEKIYVKSGIVCHPCYAVVVLRLTPGTTSQLLVELAAPPPRLAHLRCVIGRRETMNKLSRRVARALPLRKSCNHTSSTYTTSASHVTSYQSCLPAQTQNRASVHSPIAARNATHPRIIAYTPTRTMSSDADYAAFLDKANQDVAPAEQQDLSKKGYGTKSVNTSVPKALESVEEYYVSDADEPFEPVALEFEGESVSAGTVYLYQ